MTPSVAIEGYVSIDRICVRIKPGTGDVDPDDYVRVFRVTDSQLEGQVGSGEQVVRPESTLVTMRIGKAVFHALLILHVSVGVCYLMEELTLKTTNA
jgi:hypothetical protein